MRGAFGRIRIQPASQGLGAVLVGLRTLCQCIRRTAQSLRIARNIGHRFSQDGLARLLRADAELAAQRSADRRHLGALDQPLEARAAAEQLFHQVVEAALQHARDHGVERLAQRRVAGGAGGVQHLVARLAQQGGGISLLDQAEMRRDLRLQREAPQQRLAEGMDGHDLHAARRVEHPREQPPCNRHQGFRVRSARQFANLAPQVVMRAGGPLRETLGHAVGHLRRRRLGEGEAEDLGRRHVAEQQAQHAVAQHLGLA